MNAQHTTCRYCGATKDGDHELAVCWTAYYSPSGSIPCNMFVACRGCSEQAEADAHGDDPREGGMAMDVSIDTIAYRDGLDRLLDTLRFSTRDRSYLLKLHKLHRAPDDTSRAKPRTRQGSADGWSWKEEDPIGVKRQRFVKWALSKGYTMKQARIMAVRKYP